MGLAQRKVKQRIPVDPRNTKWTNDSAGIGFKLLEKMGWKAGTGLGVQGQEGPVEPIRTIQKDDHLGIGMNRKSAETWLQSIHTYDSLLQSLNAKGKEDQSSDSGVAPETKSKTKKKNRATKSKEDKTKTDQKDNDARVKKTRARKEKQQQKQKK